MGKALSGESNLSVKAHGRWITYKVVWTTKELINPVSLLSLLPPTKYHKVILKSINCENEKVNINSISKSLKDSLITGIHRERNLKK